MNPTNEPIDVLITAGKYGHLSLAEAIKGYLDIAQISNKIFLPKTKNGSLSYWLDKAYQFEYRFFPRMHDVTFKISQQKLINSGTKLWMKFKDRDSLIQCLDIHRPKIVISTFFFLNVGLKNLQPKYNYQIFNVISDPRSIHVVIPIADKAINFAFDSSAKRTIEQMFPQSINKVSGWFVKQQYEKKYNKLAVRKSLGIDKSQMNILIVAGSEGTYHSIVNLVREIIKLKSNCLVTVACGKSKALFTMIKSLTYHTPTKILPINFSTQLHKYMQSADIIVGKAGPNTLFESVATLTPFLATTYIRGQESGNLDIIQQYNIGKIELDPSKAADQLHTWTLNPELLQQFEPGLKKLKTHNQNAKSVLIQEVRKVLELNN